MVTSTIAAGVFDDADHNTTQKSLVDLFEPAGKAPRLVSRQTQLTLLGITWKAYMEGYYPLANGSCDTSSKNTTSGYVR